MTIMYHSTMVLIFQKRLVYLFGCHFVEWYDEEKWQHLDRLRVGGYQFGEMYKTSQFIDLRQMPENDRNAAIYELLSTSEIVDPTILDAEEYFKVYGLTVTEKIIKPLMRKLYGLELKALQPSAIGLVGYSRFIGFDRFQTMS